MSDFSAVETPAPTSLSEHLQQITEALAASPDQAGILQIVLHPALTALKAIAGAVLLVDATGTRLQPMAAEGYMAGAQTLWQDGSLGGNVPVGAALGQGQPLYFEHQDALIQRYPALGARIGAVVPMASAVLPMVLDGRPLGTIILDFEEPHLFTDEEKRFLETLAAQCSVALDRVQVTTALQASETRFRRLVEVSPLAMAAGSLDGQLSLTNDAYLQLIGRTRRAFEAGEIDWQAITPPEYRQDERAAFEAAWAHGVSSRYRKELLTPTGERVPVEIALVRQDEEQLVGYVQDLRPRQTQERQLLDESARLEQLVEERTKSLLDEQAASQAFITFNQQTAQTTEIPLLAEHAIAALRALLNDVSVAYYELRAGHWQAQWWSDDISPAYLQAMQAGFPQDTPRFANAVSAGELMFVDGWDPARERLPTNQGYTSIASYPFFVQGQPHSLLSIGRRGRQGWNEREQAVVRAVGQALGLALERTEIARQLQVQKEEAQHRVQALEAFEQLSRDLMQETDRYALIRQAQEIVLSLLSSGYAVYYELQDDLWRARVQSGDPGNPKLQALMDAGLPPEMPSLYRPWSTGEDFYQDEYAQGSDAPVEAVRELKAAVALVVRVQGQPIGIFTVGLFEQRTWTPVDRTVLSTAIQSLGLALDRAVQLQQLATQREEAEQRSRALEGFAELTRDLTLYEDAPVLIRQAQEVVLSLLPAGYSLYFEPDLNHDRWVVCAQTGELRSDDLQAAVDAGLPYRETRNLLLPYTTLMPYYQDEYARDTDNLEGLVAHIGASATFPVLVQGQPKGIFAVVLFGARRTWTAVERVVMETVVRSLSLALDRLHQQRTAQQEQAAMQTFVQFTEAAGQVTDRDELARLALDTLQTLIPGSNVVLTERTPTHWALRHWTDNLAPDLLAMIQQHGFPLETPVFADLVATGEPSFTDGWDETEQEVAHTRQFQAVAHYPVMQQGQVVAAIGVAVEDQRSWTQGQRAIVRSVGRSFTLLYDRIVGAEQLQRQKEEAERRGQALEAFAVLSRDLAGETSRYALIHRAQEIMLSLLTPGYALYWEEGEDRWTLQSQVSDIGDPALQRLVDEQGLPLDTPALHSTWQTGVPNYQDNYAQGADTPADMIRHVQAATAFRVEMQGRPVGMLAIGLFDQRAWTPLDKAALETAIYSLGLLLERAQGVEALAERTAQLEAANTELQLSNQELEAFTYSASHDLRTPVRHVMGFAELAEKALEKTPNERAGQHLKVVKQAALRMTDLIDGMLVLSRSGRQELHVQPVDLNALATQARRDTAAEFGGHPVRWQISHLPTVRGDAQLLQQVMTNLLSNAVKYSAKREISEVEVKFEAQETEWHISVTDNGVGFEPNYAQKLFGIFQRLHNERDFKGTGIGLATVRRIVQKHGGRVFAESDGHTGSTFGFTLPR